MASEYAWVFRPAAIAIAVGADAAKYVELFFQVTTKIELYPETREVLSALTPVRSAIVSNADQEHIAADPVRSRTRGVRPGSAPKDQVYVAWRQFTATAGTTAEGSAKAKSAAIGASVALTIANHRTEATLDRNITAAGAVSLGAHGSSDSAAARKSPIPEK